MAEDYLDQLNWKGRNVPRRPKAGWPWWTSDEPNWKYPPVITRFKVAPLFVRIFVIGGFLAGTGYLLYQAIFLKSGFAVYLTVVFLVIGAILFFAARDGAKPDDDSND